VKGVTFSMVWQSPLPVATTKLHRQTALPGHRRALPSGKERSMISLHTPLRSKNPMWLASQHWVNRATGCRYAVRVEFGPNTNRETKWTYGRAALGPETQAGARRV